MGCFTALKGKKKKCEQSTNGKSVNNSDDTLPPVMLPEPQMHGRSLQSAPPSFRTRTKHVPSTNHVKNIRTRALSAPSSLSDAERYALLAVDNDEQAEPKVHSRSTMDQKDLNPQPLPLPSPQNGAILKTNGSFKSSNAGGTVSGPGVLPLPPMGGPRNFSYEEIVSACLHFLPERCSSEGPSMVYRPSFGDDASGSKRIEATVTSLHSTQGVKDFVNEVNTLASLQHPNLCKLLGYYAREGNDQRMLVYERLYHGSLDQLLHGRPEWPPLDWYARIKVALCAAQGLAFLHEEGPFQAMYSEFLSANIQIDKDFSAKLAGYGCVSHNPDTEIASTSVPTANLPAETLERGLLTPKSNVWSFGIILLELLTGRKNLDGCHSTEERNLVKWSRPFLSDDGLLSLIIDPHLNGRFPTKATRIVADIAQRCLQKDPSERPTMRSIVESLKNIQDMKCLHRFPLQEPSVAAGKQMTRSPSLNGVVTPASRLNHSPTPPNLKQLISPSRSLIPASVPPRLCSSIVSVGNNQLHDGPKPVSPLIQWERVEGF